jgi:ubiquitin-protein ligase
MANAREIRLSSDYTHLQALARESGGTLIIDSVKGDPPTEYVLTYRCRGIEAIKDGHPVYRTTHKVRIRLPSRYPSPAAPPQVEVLTPLFHPHVYPNRTVCLGVWQTSEFLDELALRLGAMLQFDRRCLNIKDPANEEAVAWAQKNLLLLPTDNRAFRGDNPMQATPIPEDDDAPLGWIEF